MTPAKYLSDVIASSHLLITEFQLLGVGHYPDVVSKQAELETKARSLCANIDRLLPVCKDSDIPQLLDDYIFLYPIAFRQPLPQTILTTQLQRLFAAWQAGNKDIAESDIYAVIAISLRAAGAQPSTVDTNPLSSITTEAVTADQLVAFLTLRDQWLATLQAHNYFPDVTTYENYRRLALLTDEPTLPNSNSDEEKLRWYCHNRIDDLSTLSSRLLVCYRRYILSLPSSVLDFEQRTELDTTILNELLRRQDLHPLDREAYRLSITYNHLLLDD